MKNRAMYLVAAFALCAFCYAAPASAQTFTDFGVKGGVSFATLRGDDVEDASYKPGFVGGLYATIPISPTVSLQPEVLYIQKGATFEGNNAEADFNLSYLEVPLLFKFTVPTTGQIRPSLYVGPYGAIAVQQEVSGEYFSVNVEEALKDVDYGVTLGGSLGFMFSGQAVMLGARYDLGLANIFDEDEEVFDDEGEDPAFEAQTGALSVTLGIAF